MKLKDLVGKSFMISKNFTIGMFAASMCYGLRLGESKKGHSYGGESSKGLIFVGYSHIDEDVYCAVLTQEYLDENLLDRNSIAISSNHYAHFIIKKMFENINIDSFKSVGLI